MNFSQPNPTEEELRGAFVDAGIVVSAAIPTALSYVLVASDVNWIFVLGGTLPVFLAGAWVTFELVRLRREPLADRRVTDIVSPRTSLVIVGSCTVGIGVSVLGTGSQALLYRSLAFLPVVVIAIIGDLTMQMIIWALAVAVVGFDGALAAHLGAGKLAASIVVYAALFAGTQASVAHMVRGLGAAARSRHALEHLSRVFVAEESLTDNLERSLPVVGEVLPTERVVAFAVGSEVRNSRILASWPEWSGLDLNLPDEPAFTTAIATNQTVLERNICFVPCGFIGKEELTLAIRLHRKRQSLWQSLKTEGTSDSFVLGMIDAVASSYLRMTARTSFFDTLKHESRTDPLTGLANRRALTERLEIEAARTSRLGTSLCLAIVDLDHFKTYNDTFGHLAGDKLLEDITAAMSARLRTQDLLARFGGDELCVLLPDTALEMACELMDELRSLVKGLPALRQVTMSAGVAQMYPGEELATLLRRADHALYEAKEAGRDRIGSIASTSV